MVHLATGLQGMLKLQVNTAGRIVTNGVHDLWGTMCLRLPCLYLQKEKKIFSVDII